MQLATHVGIISETYIFRKQVIPSLVTNFSVMEDVIHKGKVHFKIVFKGKGKEGKESFFYVGSSE